MDHDGGCPRLFTVDAYGLSWLTIVNNLFLWCANLKLPFLQNIFSSALDTMVFRAGNSRTTFEVEGFEGGEKEDLGRCSRK